MTRSIVCLALVALGAACAAPVKDESGEAEGATTTQAPVDKDDCTNQGPELAAELLGMKIYAANVEVGAFYRVPVGDHGRLGTVGCKVAGGSEGMSLAGTQVFELHLAKPVTPKPRRESNSCKIQELHTNSVSSLGLDCGASFTGDGLSHGTGTVAIH